MEYPTENDIVSINKIEKQLEMLGEDATLEEILEAIAKATNRSYGEVDELYRKLKANYN